MPVLEFLSRSRGVGKTAVKWDDYLRLDGNVEHLVKQVNSGEIIKRFDKTPFPRKPSDVVCPHFLELKWAYGCPFNCAWCFLQGTLRFIGKNPRVKPYKLTLSHTRAFLESDSPPEMLNTGELADSLMSERSEDPFSIRIIPLFEEYGKHKVLFLSKAPWVENILKLDGQKTTVMSFSLNALPVAKRWEKAPSPLLRIEAAKKVWEAGYETRIRIDPIVPVENWKKHYLELVDLIFENLTPERITLGTLRGLQTTINNAYDKSWVKYLSERSNWGLKPAFKTRLEIYQTIINYLKDKYNYKNVALCKETMEMWNALRLDYRKIRCNCIL